MLLLQTLTAHFLDPRKIIMEEHLRDLEARYEEVTRMLATPETSLSALRMRSARSTESPPSDGSSATLSSLKPFCAFRGSG